MKVSLNKANKLRNALEGLVISIPMSVPFRSDTGISEEVLKQGEVVWETGITSKMDQLKHAHDLRSLIQKANHQFGINTLIGRISVTERVIKMLGELSASVARNPSKTKEEVQADLDFRKTQAERDAAYARAPERISVSVVPVTFAKEVVESIKQAKLELEELKEKRNELNNSSFVELPKDMVKFLREQHLLKA